MAVITPDLPEIFEEAFERAGLQMQTGYDLKTARRSLNLLTLEWQNRGLNLWTIDSGTQALTAGTATYQMPADTIDLIEHQVRTGSGTEQVDTSLERISVSSYAQQSVKICKDGLLKFLLIVKQRLSMLLCGLCRILARILYRISAYAESMASRLE